MRNEKKTFGIGKIVLLAGILLLAVGMLLFIGFTQYDLAHKITLLSYKKISSASDLAAMRTDPDGKYVLSCDIDMQGQNWTPFTFSGVLDGNGHQITNLTITDMGEAVRETYDGNMKVYDTHFAALFDVMDHATVRNLTLSQIKVDTQADIPVFASTIAGYIEQSTIQNCKIDGSVWLRAHDRMFGVGGVAGYGNGMIENVDIRITLVCIDMDRETKDEQFMGGICAAGYPDIVNCYVEIDGYDSEHGYAHNGGLIGMYMFYPKGVMYEGKMIDNLIIGKITFFEDNEDRRAYCSALTGELMNKIAIDHGNAADFLRDEVYEYDKDLLPET